MSTNTPDPNQFSMDDALRARDEAMDAVGKAAEPTWFDEAITALWNTASTMKRFIVDDVWIVGKLPGTRENRAMGPVMRYGSKHKWIRATTEFRKTARKTSHASPTQVWESLIYEEGDGAGVAPSPVPVPAAMAS